MMTNKEDEQNQLLLAVRTLSIDVHNLREDLKEYPRRQEVAKDGRKRALGTLAFGVVLILFAQLLTITTVSYCFLAPSGTTHSVCNLMPGYENTVKTGKVRLQRFDLLIKQIEQNQKDIAELKAQVSTLKAGSR